MKMDNAKHDIPIRRSDSPRQSNIELLRIIAIVLIIAHHFATHGNFHFSTETITVNRLWVQFISMGGKVGVNIFVLISGYFSVVSSKRKTTKAIMLWLQIFSYSILFFAILYSVAFFTGIGTELVGIKAFIRRCFPITFEGWWFASTYFVLYLLSPYINLFLSVLDKRTYQRMLILLTFCWSIIPTLLIGKFECSYLLWFMYLYAMGRYLHLHTPEGIQGKSYIAVSIIMMILMYLSVIVFDFMGTKIVFFARHATHFYEMQRLPTLLSAVLLFVGFTKINIGYKRMINLLASSTFGIYLIHDDPYVRNFLWMKFFRNASFSESPLLVPYSCLVIACVFCFCAFAEWCRKNIVEKRYLGIVNRIAIIVDKKIENFLSLNIWKKI